MWTRMWRWRRAQSIAAVTVSPGLRSLGAAGTWTISPGASPLRVSVIAIAPRNRRHVVDVLHQMSAVDRGIGLLGWGKPSADLARPRKCRRGLARRPVDGRL